MSGPRDRRAAILDAARAGFAARGYERTTIRAVARAADVDPALVMHHFGSKHGLLVAALELPVDPAQLLPSVLRPVDASAGERLVRFFVTMTDGEAGSRVAALARTGLTSEEARPLFREFVERVVVGALRECLEGPDAPIRAATVSATLFGLLTARRLVGLEPLASASVDEVVAAFAPALQAVLTPGADPGPAPAVRGRAR